MRLREKDCALTEEKRSKKYDGDRLYVLRDVAQVYEIHDADIRLVLQTASAHLSGFIRRLKFYSL